MSVGIDGPGVRVGIDNPGGMVDGARGEVNDARMFQGTERPRTCECGDVIRQQGLHLLWVRCLAVPQYRKRELWGANAD